MSILLAIPVFGILLMIQSAIISRMPLLNGTSDLVMLALIAWTVHARVKTAWPWSLIAGLMFGIASALPPGTALIGYLFVTGIALLLRRWIWQVPLLAMIAATLFGTLITHGLDVLSLQFTGISVPLITAFNTTTLPSAILNLVLAIPVYAIITDLANWVYPEEIEI
jgi:cell shape-determining protein MreD